jgi:hypothetical protein
VRGESLAAFFTVNVSVFSLANATVWGAGPNVRCSQAYEVDFENPRTYAEVGGWMLGPNNTTDQYEPNFAILFYGSSYTVDSLHFDNSFSHPNRSNITTCSGPAQSLPLVQSDYLDVSFPVTIGGQNLSIPYELTVQQTFHYWFPANFGIWQVDNLSAPGGPGGGWAFSYSPCP